ncbi:large ribosomal subunit protein mL65-like [Ptychodera flava]|uniref:large ribosomal subunit protein mL65-like n=1 Tax=Ptychodera flava TaxID=63121 RepID=UPI00396A79FD
MAAAMWNVVHKVCTTTSLSKFAVPNGYRIATVRARSTTVEFQGDDEKYFPPIPPYLTEAEREREKLLSKVNSVETAREMIGILTKQQAWTFLPALFNTHPFCQQYYQHLTKTAIVEGLPDAVVNADTQLVTEELLQALTDSVEQELLYVDRSQIKRERHNVNPSLRARWMQESLIRAIVTSQCGYYPHLMGCELDLQALVRSFWLRNEYRFQINYSPFCLLRTSEPLPEVVSMESDLSLGGEIPEYKYGPRTMSTFRKHLNNQCYPGCKLTDDKMKCGHTQILVPAMFDRKRSVGEKLLTERINNCGLISGFGWANAIAMANKHFWFEDVKKPVVVQTIFTNDGQHYTFFVYQLNTLGLDPLSDETNPKRNILWTSGEMKLYEDIQDDKIVGLNHDVLKHYVAFIVKETISRTELTHQPDHDIVKN